MFCNICGTENGNKEKFCKKCIAPINIKHFYEFTESDYIENFGALFETITNVIDDIGQDNKTDLLKVYLNSFWLRPETALYCATEANILKKVLKDIDSSKFLDLGCGNGVHTSIINGWEFKEDFDVFDSLSINSNDIYNSPLNKKNTINFKKIGSKISYGLDIKKNMIERAEHLNTFENLFCTKGENIPVKDNEVDVVYSNVLRDFEDSLLKTTLNEINRITKKDGYLVFTTPTEYYQQHLYFYPRANNFKKNNLNQLAKDYYMFDRGRSIFCTQQISMSKWKCHLNRHNFEIIKTLPFAGKKMMEFWDTGLRPYTSLIINCLNKISIKNKSFLKIKTIDFFHKILSKTIQNDHTSDSFAFQIIVARKK